MLFVIQMKILAIDTSADETAVAVTEGRKVLSNALFSQISTHTKWGGIYPALAKRAHEERIDWVVSEALRKLETRNSKLETNSKSQIKKKKNNLAIEQFNNEAMNHIDYIAVTQGPGLAVALEVGIRKAKELAQKYNKKLISVNHLEGHIYSSFVQNSKGNPKREYKFPYLTLVISGGHTEIVLWKDHLKYEILGETLDDAAGEALDKAAKMLGLGYPGGPVIERLAKEVENKDFYQFPRPMLKSKTLEFSFSGLKTAFYYYLLKTDSVFPLSSSTESVSEGRQTDPVEPERHKKTGSVEIHLRELASSFQIAVFETLIKKTEMAIIQTKVNRLVVGGGVIANLHLRKLFKELVVGYKGDIYFPPYKYLTGDNAAMIGVAGSYKAQESKFVTDPLKLDRIPRLRLS